MFQMYTPEERGGVVSMTTRGDFCVYCCYNSTAMCEQEIRLSCNKVEINEEWTGKYFYFTSSPDFTVIECITNIYNRMFQSHFFLLTVRL